MSIGDALAAARRQAGLTITQVSQRTCIRETIVRGIERGDYSACGGDFYARGHIRSIARAVGLDPEELIREYDATEAPPQPITAADVFQPFTPVKLRERRRLNWSVVLLVGVVAVLGIVGFRYFSSRHPGHSRPPAAASSGQPKASKTPADTRPVSHHGAHPRAAHAGGHDRQRDLGPGDDRERNHPVLRATSTARDHEQDVDLQAQRSRCSSGIRPGRPCT